MEFAAVPDRNSQGSDALLLQPWTNATLLDLSSIRYVLTDMDETLTHKGRLSAATYSALERLQNAGIVVIPVTAAPAGWADQMARMWPIDGVIAENGGLFLRRNADHGVDRIYWHDEAAMQGLPDRLRDIVSAVLAEVPQAQLADDQPFRLTSVAFERSDIPGEDTLVLNALRKAGASVTINNLWVLGWIGAYDKLTMTRRILSATWDLDMDREQNQILYSGDSANDAPMFAYFQHTVGVSTVRQHLEHIPVPPRWVTQGPGGSGFVEIVDCILGSSVL